MSQITNYLNNEDIVLVIFIDFTKAFDSISHDVLLNKLKYQFKFSSNAIEWFESYLKGRSQYVVINNSNSDIINIQHGVPQGSILGPLLFKLYINDIHTVFTKNLIDVVMFADDLGLTIHIAKNELNNAVNIINNELINFQDYCTKNQLFINIKKSKIMLFNKNDIIKDIFHGKILINNEPLD